MTFLSHRGFGFAFKLRSVAPTKVHFYLFVSLLPPLIPGYLHPQDNNDESLWQYSEEEQIFFPTTGNSV